MVCCNDFSDYYIGHRPSSQLFIKNTTISKLAMLPSADKKTGRKGAYSGGT
jgi:hypothetical protein